MKAVIYLVDDDGRERLDLQVKTGGGHEVELVAWERFENFVWALRGSLDREAIVKGLAPVDPDRLTEWMLKVEREGDLEQPLAVDELAAVELIRTHECADLRIMARERIETFTWWLQGYVDRLEAPPTAAGGAAAGV